MTSPLHQTVSNIELAHDYSQISILGIPVWAHIRFNLSNFENSGTFTIGRSSRRARVNLIVQSLFKKFSLQGVDVLSISQSGYMAELAGKIVNKFLTPVTAALRSHNIESRNLLIAKPGVAVDLYTFQDRWELFPQKIYLLALLLKLAKRRHLLRQMQGILNVLAENGLHLSSKQLSIVVNGFFLTAAANLYFKRKLRANPPKAVFVTCFYTPVVAGVVAAANSLGIATVDLQHGVIHDSHLAYAHWHLPSGRLCILLPKYFWVWSEHDRDLIESWAISGQHITIVTGNQWHRYAQTNFKPTPEAGIWIEKIASLKRPIVLISLQHGVSNYGLLDWFVSFVKSHQGSYEFVVRNHPALFDQESQVQEQTAFCGITPENFRFATDLPLPVLLCLCTLHITFNSSVIIEASQFGVPSIGLSTSCEELYPTQKTHGLLAVATSLGDLENRVREFSKLKHQKRDHQESVRELKQAIMQVVG